MGAKRDQKTKVIFQRIKLKYHQYNIKGAIMNGSFCFYKMLVLNLINNIYCSLSLNKKRTLF
ncbi:hypothetical protein DF182_29400 [Chitinophaga flava]|uniref:Uncharacterized protein n=1 Tax=Chitinophaga flava TaxID=2259036 RepID=A0A365XXZ0_9BACT|nr:hypothetical protein DF182_29400 [Chitinophaga flava]